MPASLTAGSGAFYCTFSRTATSVNPGNGIDDDTVSIAAAGSAAGLPTGATNGGATIKVAPAPHLATNIQADRYRLGDNGDGNNGVADYSNGGLALSRDTTSTLPEIKNPTGWFNLTVVNSGGAASNFNVSVTQAGTPISLPSSCPPIPATLAASGQPGDTYTCNFPRSFSATQAYALAATASAKDNRPEGVGPRSGRLTRRCGAAKAPADGRELRADLGEGAGGEYAQEHDGHRRPARCRPTGPRESAGQASRTGAAPTSTPSRRAPDDFCVARSGATVTAWPAVL